MVKRGRPEVLKWAAVLLVVNLMIGGASWLRKRGDALRESEADGPTKEASNVALSKCPPAQLHCPSIECTKTDLQRCASEVGTP